MKPSITTKSKPRKTMPRTAPPPALHGRWLLYRVLMGDGDAALRVGLANDDLPVPGGDTLSAIRAGLALPRNFKPGSTTHKASAQYIFRSECRRLFHEPERLERAVRLLRNSRARELVEAAALLGVPHEAVVRTLGSYLKFAATVEDLNIYGHAFFDVSAVTRAQLRVLVQRHVQLAVGRVAGEHADAPAVRRAVSSDARMVAVSLPASPAGWSAVMMSLGYMPGKVELPQILTHLESVAIARVGQALLRGGRDDEKRAEGFVGVLRTLRQVHEGAVSPEQELSAKLQQFTIKTDDRPLMSLADLRARGDQVTVDVVPAVDPRVNESEPMDGDGGEFDEAVGGA